MRLSRLAIISLLVAFATACAARIPSQSDFTVPAIGTLMPGGHEEAVSLDLAANQSGALVINQTGFRIQVAVSNTITSMAIGEDFLFMLAPGTYQFFIYRPDSVPYVHTETLDGGKLRYLYLTPLLGNTNGK
jgi:hypothetical protein